MNRLSEVFKEANRAAEERMKRFDAFRESSQGKEFIARCSKQDPNPAFIEANKAAQKRMTGKIAVFGGKI